MLTIWLIASLVAWVVTTLHSLTRTSFYPFSRPAAIAMLPVYLLQFSWPIPAILLIVL